MGDKDPLTDVREEDSVLAFAMVSVVGLFCFKLTVSFRGL